VEKAFFVGPVGGEINFSTYLCANVIMDIHDLAIQYTTITSTDLDNEKMDTFSRRSLDDRGADFGG
jgi:hypothetical protein